MLSNKSRRSSISLANCIRRVGVPAFFLMTTAVQACPLCKDSVPNSDAQATAALPSGMNTSVYFMLSGLFVVIGLVTSIIVKGVRDTNNYSGPRGFPVHHSR